MVLDANFRVRWGGAISTTRVVVTCADFPFADPSNRTLVYRDQVSLTHNYYGRRLQIVCVGSQSVMRDRFAELLGAGAGRIVDSLYLQARSNVYPPFMSELDVLMPANTIDRIVMYLNQSGVPTS